MGGFIKKAYSTRRSPQRRLLTAVILVGLVVACGSGQGSERDSGDNQSEVEAPVGTEADSGSLPELDRGAAAAAIEEYAQALDPFAFPGPCVYGGEFESRNGELHDQAVAAGVAEWFFDDGTLLVGVSDDAIGDEFRSHVQSIEGGSAAGAGIRVAFCDGIVVEVTGITETSALAYASAEFTWEADRSGVGATLYEVFADFIPAEVKEGYTSLSGEGDAAFTLYDDGWRLDDSSIWD